MSHSDYTAESLARYLHLSPQQVAKLAERGQLPGRKVSGEWRFSGPEIHRWFENRIGVSGEAELLDVENVLRRSNPAHAADVSIAELLPLEAIAVPLLARTRNSVIDSMAELAAATGMLWDARAMADAVRAREDMHTTALENGVALLHPRRPMAQFLSEPILALGCTTCGIPFGQNVPLSDVFFLVCSMEDAGHLRVLARLSRVLAAPGFLNGLHQAEDAHAARELIIEVESKL
ncbi:MAG: PTS sugar transporter subunit IIA [Planctomycetota bacterium]